LTKLKIVGTNSLSDTAYQTLRQAILSGELAAGFFASDRELCEQFSFSRTPVREAVLRLRDEQLVEVLPRKGMRVCPLMVDDMREMSGLLKALSIQACLDIVAETVDFSAIKAVEADMLLMEKNVASDDRTAWLDAEQSFHMRLIDLCGNKRLISIYTNLFGLMERARYFTLYLRETPTKSTLEYRSMCKSLTGESELPLANLLRDHWDRSSAEILMLVSKYTKGTVRASFEM
tara:strand:+ start:826 stop:1524 length:699 start_codon:yes stop_codon:yes gene_type:complete